MEDKQITIDGVDVCECDCYYDGKCLCEYNEINRRIIRYYSCKKFPNCYYKQLKRKEQECEELGGRLKYILDENKVLKDCAANEHIDILALKNYISTLEFHIDQLKTENERLLKECEMRKNQALTIDDETITVQITQQQFEEYKQLKQILTEIKDFVENEMVPNSDTYIILQKIREVENG